MHILEENKRKETSENYGLSESIQQQDSMVSATLNSSMLSTTRK